MSFRMRVCLMSFVWVIGGVVSCAADREGEPGDWTAGIQDGPRPDVLVDAAAPADAAGQAVAPDGTGGGDTPSAEIPDVGADGGDDAGANDGDEGATDAAGADVPPVPDPALRLRQAGWLSGDLHIHTTYSDGKDSVATVVGLAEYLADPVFLGFHPEYAGNPVDFIALTDHRTAGQNLDPAFVSDRVVLVPGEEFGQPGHANLFGVTATVPHDPDGDGSTLEDYANGLDTAHAQGGLASINHPYSSGILFPWDLSNFDAVEVWNVRFSLSQPGATPADVDAWEAAKKSTAGAAFRRGADFQGIGGNAQALKFYEALLARGKHAAVVGGSDWHTVFPIGFPATWVRTDSRDVAGVLDGIRRRHTFVARTPASATVELSATVDGAEYRMGDSLPVAAGGSEVVFRVRVTRAPGGRVLLIAGRAVESDEALAGAPLGETVLDLPVVGIDFEAVHTATLEPGDWIYPVVHEPLVPDGLDPALAAAVPGIVQKVAAFSDDNYAPLLEGLMPYMDVPVLLDPATCDPSAWQPQLAQCIPSDQEGMASLFLPDWIDRILNVVFLDGGPTEWTLGAVGSAMRAVGATTRPRSLPTGPRRQNRKA
jgi:hypothetical protein